MRLSLLVAQVATISLGYTVASAVELDPRDSNANSNLVTCKAIQLLMSSQSAVYYPGTLLHMRPHFSQLTEHCVQKDP